MSGFDYNGKRIYYEDTGSGRPLLLLHGNTASGRMFAPIVPTLAKKHRVLTMDFQGCGRSERIEKWPEDLWYEWSAQAAALCGHLGLKNVNVIGSSGGALAAINMALSHEELVHAVIADSFEGIRADPSLTENIRIGRSVAKQDTVFRSALQMMHGDDWESVLDADTEAIAGHAAHIGDFFHRPLACLKRKMLLTGSAEDEMFPRGHYAELFARICAETPYASAHIFPHGGHPAMMSSIEDFILLCEAFFSEL